MKQFIRKSIYVAAFLCATSLSTQVTAQNVATVGSNVTVNNTITAALGNTGLNFGITALVPGVEGLTTPTDQDLSSSATVSSGGVLTAAVGEAGVPAEGDVDAIAAVVDDTNAQAALINISDVVDGSTINITIDNIAQPQAGFNTLGLDDFLTSFNGGTQSAARTLVSGSVSFTETYSASFGGGINTLAIGGTITAGEGVTINEGTPYTGSFDVTVSY